MVRVIKPPSDLQRFSEAVLALHACRGPQDLAAAFLAAMRAVCDADRYTINSIGPRRMGVFTTTEEFTPQQLEIFNAHLSEHPLASIIEESTTKGVDTAAQWSDRKSFREIEKTGIYQDFFLPTETRSQLACVIPVNAEVMLGLAFNRSKGKFRTEDVRLAEMLIPHVRQLAQRMIGQMEVNEVLSLWALAVGNEAMAVVDAQGTLLFATEQAQRMMRDHFAESTGDGLPLRIRKWLQSNPGADQHLVCEQEGRRLVCICGCLSLAPEVGLDRLWAGGRRSREVRRLRFIERDESKELRKLQELGLTPREAEVLYWMAQGKRNGEIATILQMSPRTADKHTEHLFSKLTVETRAAAVAMAAGILGPG